MINLIIFNEFIDEKIRENVKAIYPNGIHKALEQGLQCKDINIKTVTIDNVNEELSEEVLENTDVLMWWGHIAHDKVSDDTAKRIQKAILKGMGFISLHSSVQSKPFRLLMGTSCDLTWREEDDFEFLWVCNPLHPIAQDINRYIKLEHEEAYGEPFIIPTPDELVFIAAYEGGEAFRAGCCFNRGYGKIFYFQPGHEEFPTYKNPEILKVLKNAVKWAAPQKRVSELSSPNVKKPILL